MSTDTKAPRKRARRMFPPDFIHESASWPLTITYCGDFIGDDWFVIRKPVFIRAGMPDKGQIAVDCDGIVDILSNIRQGNWDYEDIAEQLGQLLLDAGVEVEYDAEPDDPLYAARMP